MNYSLIIRFYINIYIEQMKMFTLLIVIAMVMAQDNFLEKSKHQLRK